jgi:hypothetical protein
MWFRYERNFARQWNPVVYHDERPKIPGGHEDQYTVAAAVPQECIGSSGEPMFGRLQAMFPPPASREVEP